MNARRNSLYILPVIFIWIGFLGAISFMEAWLKFRAPGVTLPIGLSIGKLVFAALNKMEWIFCLLILWQLVQIRVPLLSGRSVFFLVPFLIVVLQTFWALPALDQIADLYIRHKPAPHSDLHVYYVGMELVKLICLILLGIKWLTQQSEISSGTAE